MSEKDASHRPECWCNGTGWRKDLGARVRCNLPQLTDSEAAWVTQQEAPVTSPPEEGR